VAVLPRPRTPSGVSSLDRGYPLVCGPSRYRCWRCLSAPAPVAGHHFRHREEDGGPPPLARHPYRAASAR
jgi:hypothetical protein